MSGIGNFYIADQWNSRIRKVTASTGIISSIATGLSSPLGVAVDSSGNVYIADTNNHLIKKVDAVTGAVSSIATSGSFSYPYGVDVDTSGKTCRQISYVTPSYP